MNGERPQGKGKGGRRPDHTHSLRLTFAFDESEIQLVRAERIEMITPGSTRYLSEGGEAGYAVDVRNTDGELLFRQPLHDPLQQTTEVFSPEGSIHRIENPRREGEFTVLVPDLPDAAEFSLHGPSPKKPPWHGKTRELARHDFEELRKRSERGEEEQ